MYPSFNLHLDHRVALVGSYTPRQCGIATFTEHLGEALGEVLSHRPVIVAMNDEGQSYVYGEEVVAEIRQNVREDYLAAAQLLNGSDVDVVSLQHEYGIFGGMAGDYIVDFVRALTKPCVVTLHTVLSNPDPLQKSVIRRLDQMVGKFVVMSQRGVELLQRVYGLRPDRISLIHHGVPDFHQVPASPRDATSGATLLTFGLLSPDKGIENVIAALPGILAHCPDCRYLVVGATHPHVRHHHGEAYRESLMALAESLGVADSVTFLNRFVSEGELTLLLKEADIYITPYLKLEQITSGTLAYAMGSGKAIISTPYWYASELLSEDRGILVPCRNPEAIAHSVVRLLTEPDFRAQIEANAGQLGAQMTWPAVAQQYGHQFSVVRAKGVQYPIEAIFATQEAVAGPVVNKHLLRLTDDVGLLQHATYTVPRYGEGYCIDDNARALYLMGLYDMGQSVDKEVVSRLSNRYLGFVAYAYNERLGVFRNFMSYSREWLEEVGSQDSQGRTLFGLAGFAVRTTDPALKELSLELAARAIPPVQRFRFPRSWAYGLLGLAELYRYGLLAREYELMLDQLTEQLLTLLVDHRRAGWPWFEDALTYCNARLPQALLVGATLVGRPRGVELALESLEWLSEEQMGAGGTFEPIGCDHAYVRGGAKPRFDQQPVEPASMVSACLTAYQVTGDWTWRNRAELAYSWFHGNNHLRMPMVDAKTGGCFDGLKEFTVNSNQGAESTVSFLIAQEEIRHLASQTPQRARTGQASLY